MGVLGPFYILNVISRDRVNFHLTLIRGGGITYKIFHLKIIKKSAKGRGQIIISLPRDNFNHVPWWPVLTDRCQFPLDEKTRSRSQVVLVSWRDAERTNLRLFF